MAASTGGEDVENDLRPVHDPDIELTLEVGALHRGQFFVEDDEGGVGGGDFARYLLDLSLTDEGSGIGGRDVLRDAAHHFGTGGVHQPGQLFQMFGDVPRVG